MGGCVLRPIDSEVIRDGTPGHLLSLGLAKDVKLGFHTVPTGNRTPGRCVAFHYTYHCATPASQIFGYSPKRYQFVSTQSNYYVDAFRGFDDIYFIEWQVDFCLVNVASL